MAIDHAKVEDYVVAHTSPEPPLLHEIERHTYLNILQPQMLSGHMQGRLLSLISQTVQPKRILELGTFTGYSALCLVEGLQHDGELITIERNDELEDVIKENILKHPRHRSIRLIIGNATEELPTMNGKFDLVFIDADKTEYPQYLKLIKPLLNHGAILIADNVLWYGKVTDTVTHNDSSTIALALFNKMIQSDPDFFNLLMPLRDGLMLARFQPQA